MDSKHTPGPWIMDTGDDGAVVYDPNAGTIANIPPDLRAWEANARLMAAAPDLLEALEGLINICTHPKATKADIRMIALEARAAIAKATNPAPTR